MFSRKQYNAAKLYLEKKEYCLKEKDSICILWVLGTTLLVVFLFVLKFIVAS